MAVIAGRKLGIGGCTPCSRINVHHLHQLTWEGYWRRPRGAIGNQAMGTRTIASRAIRGRRCPACAVTESVVDPGLPSPALRYDLRPPEPGEALGRRLPQGPREEARHRRRRAALVSEPG